MSKSLDVDPLTPPPDWPSALQDDLLASQKNGHVGHCLLSETDRVRVWRIELAPGERIGFHRHQLDYFWVAINPGRARSHYASGAIRDAGYSAGDTRHIAFSAGEYMLHDLENIGDSVLIFTTVEFKDGANLPLPL